MVLTKKQQDYLSLSQLYQYFNSPHRKFRDIFQTTLEELSSKSFEIGVTLCRIRDEGILNLENFSLILFHSSPFEIASGLIQLHHSNLLTVENKKVLEGHINPSGMALVLRLLNSVNLLSAANRRAIQEKNEPYLLASVLFKLFYAHLFTQKNFDSVLAHPNLQDLSHKLHGFNRQNSLTQTLLEQLIQSQQENSSLSHDLNKLKKINFPSKSVPNKLIYRCGTSFFHVQKQQHDSESLSQTIEALRIE